MNMTGIKISTMVETGAVALRRTFFHMIAFIWRKAKDMVTMLIDEEKGQRV